MTSRILYLHGFASGPGSKKARYFKQRFAEHGITLEVPDLAPGGFENLTVTGQLEVIERTANGEPVSLMGSSLGGYLAALYAARHPETPRIGLMAPAFCFPRRWEQSLGPEKFAAWESTGWLPVHHYGANATARVHFELIRDGRRYEDYPEVQQPCLIYHGTKDDVVPVAYSQTFAQGRANVELHAVESDHELIDVLEPMWLRVKEFLIQSGT